jgi:hypothetical protein
MQRSLRKTFVSAGLVLAIVTGGLSARADDPPAKAALTEEQQAEAKAQFTAGVNLLDDPDGAKYEEAYRAFKRAYAITQSPKILGNIAFCAMHLERDGEAIDGYTTYLREVPDISERERAQIQRDLTTLTATVGRAKIVVVEEPPSEGDDSSEPKERTFTLVDRRSQTRGAPIENVYTFQGKELSLRLRPGRHTFVVKFPEGLESAPVEATIEPGGSSTLEFRPAQPTAPQQVVFEQPQSPRTKQARPSIAGPVALAVTGLAGIGFGAISGVVAQSKTADIEERCPQNLCPASYDFVADRTTAKTWGTIADVSFVAGGALVLGGVLWYVLLPKGDTSRAAKPTRTAWLPSAGCTGTGCGLQLQRGF